MILMTSEVVSLHRDCLDSGSGVKQFPASVSYPLSNSPSGKTVVLRLWVLDQHHHGSLLELHIFGSTCLESGDVGFTLSYFLPTFTPVDVMQE
jgi:hypothetical protein